MAEPLTVAFTVYNRPGYLRETLASWRSARGADRARFVFSLEPGCRENLAVIRSAGLRWVVRVNAARLGCQANNRAALGLGFASGAGFVVLADDDQIVADDVLEYFTWARDAYAADEQVAVVCAHHHMAAQAGPGEAFRLPLFFSQGWGTWADRWTGWIADTWDAGYEHGGYDANLLRLMRDRGQVALFPAWARTRHIGVRGEHTRSRDEFAATLPAEFRPSNPPAAWREVPLPPKSLLRECAATWEPREGRP